MKMLFKLGVLILLSISTLSCDDDDNCVTVACTEIFVTIEISVVDDNQNPVALDAIEVTDLNTGQDQTIALSPEEFTQAQNTGVYPLITDGILGDNEERRLQFKGFQNNEEVISSDYTVATDCCHIALISGERQLSL